MNLNKELEFLSIPIKNVGLTVSEKHSHFFKGYGMYIGGCGKVNEEVQKEIEEKIFVGLGTKVVHECFEMTYPHWNPKYKNFKEGEDHLNPYDIDALDAWIEEHIENIGYGGRKFTADMKKYGAVYAMNMCGLQSHHLSEKTVSQMYAGANEETLSIVRGNGAETTIVNEGVHPIDDEYIPTFVDTAVNLVERMIKVFEMPIKYVSLYDEPNFGVITPHQMCRIIKLTRKKLDEKGLKDVLINGPASAGINLAYSEAIKAIDPEAFSMYDKITVHGYSTGMMDEIHKEQMLKIGKELWITSTGAPGDCKFSDLPRKENGEIFDNSDVYGVVNASAVLVDVNLGASYMGAWHPLASISNLDRLMQYYMFIVDKTTDKSVLGKDLLVTRFYDYVSTIMKAVENDAQIYYCESSEEGSMTERHDITNSLNNQMAALVGKNKDGKWGIAVLNKTDTETRLKELSNLYENTKPHNLAGHSVCLEVELDIKPLYGSGRKEFRVFKTGKNGKYLEEGELITIENGKGILTVSPFEIIAAKEV